MAAKYPNFAAEMARTNTSYDDVYKHVAKVTKRSIDTVSNWFTGRAGELSVTAAFATKDKFFPNLQVDYLFSEQPKNQQIW